MTDPVLLGDKTAELLKKVGADKIAEAYARIVGRPCACNRRKEMLNRVHQAILGQSVQDPPKPTIPVDEMKRPPMPSTN